jgi:hypothetical protein
VGGRFLDRQPLSDVVDSTLDDQDVSSLGALVEAGGHLVGALAADSAVAKARTR